MDNPSTKFTLDELWDDVSRYIDVDANGRIRYQSIFEKWWEDAGGCFDTFMTCVESNVCQDDEGENIDWNETRKDYEKMMKLYEVDT
jgi:hypothetical protein